MLLLKISKTSLRLSLGIGHSIQRFLWLALIRLKPFGDVTQLVLQFWLCSASKGFLLLHYGYMISQKVFSHFALLSSTRWTFFSKACSIVSRPENLLGAGHCTAAFLQHLWYPKDRLIQILNLLWDGASLDSKYQTSKVLSSILERSVDRSFTCLTCQLILVNCRLLLSILLSSSKNHKFRVHRSLETEIVSKSRSFLFDPLLPFDGHTWHNRWKKVAKIFHALQFWRTALTITTQIAHIQHFLNIRSAVSWHALFNFFGRILRRYGDVTGISQRKQLDYRERNANNIRILG